MRLARFGLLCLWALPLWIQTLWAAPQEYRIDRTSSTVAFTFSALGTPTRARAPVSTGVFALDFQDISNSRIDVHVDTSRVRAAVPFVAQTLKGPDGLDAAAHPEAWFQSRDIRLNVPGDFTRGARIAGTLTIKGQSRPVVLQAMLKRRAGSDPSDLSQLLVEVTGEVDRRAFGITSYGDMVGPMIALEIDARLEQR